MPRLPLLPLLACAVLACATLVALPASARAAGEASQDGAFSDEASPDQAPAADDRANGEPRLRIAVYPPRPGPASPVQIELEGLPVGGCTPALDSMRRLESTVSIRLRQVAGCSAVAAASRPLPVREHGQDLRWGSRGVHRLRVEDDGGPGGTPRLLGFRLLQVGSEPRTVAPEAGYWWNESGGEFDAAGPGFGLNLERQGDTLSVTVLGYAADGRPEWLFGAGPIVGRIARVGLSRLQGGRGPFEPWQAPGSAEPVGLVHFEFLSEARAVAWFEREAPHGGITLVPLSLVRFRFDQQQSSALLGEWLLLGGVQGEDAGQATVLRFDAVDAGTEAFVLGSAEGGHTLECSLDPLRPNSPPPRCVLRDARGTLLVDFTDTALGRMRGWRPDGAAVTLLRRPAD